MALTLARISRVARRGAAAGGLACLLALGAAAPVAATDPELAPDADRAQATVRLSEVRVAAGRVVDPSGVEWTLEAGRLVGAGSSQGARPVELDGVEWTLLRAPTPGVVGPTPD